MRKLYNEYFHIPERGKIRDKVMLIRTAITTIIMLACLAAMSFSAYAYFSCNITSGFNSIKAASFAVDVSISIIDPNNKFVPVTKDDLAYTAELKAGNTYSVTLSYPTDDENAAETGFCVITAKNCTSIYHTQQLGTDESVEDGKTPSITFTLTVSNDTTVEILSHWGTSSHYAEYAEKGENCELYITNENVGDNKVEMIIKDAADGSGDADGKTTSTTTGSTTSTVSSSTSAATQSVETTTSKATATSEQTATTVSSTSSTETTTTRPTETLTETTGAPTTEASE